MFGKEDMENKAAETSIANGTDGPTEWGCTLELELRGSYTFSKLEITQEILDGINAFHSEATLTIKDFRIDRLASDYPVDSQ